jgi:NAD(P)-dependent dehydrogenase (short-subunit alcohol dehydrogenase family)
MITLKDKVVVITGASSGIGAAAAMQFAQKGAAVVLAARRMERLKELEKRIIAFGGKCLCVRADVTSEDDVDRLFDEALSRFGRIDILVNNAGRGLKAKIVDIEYVQWQSVIETNLTSVFLCTKRAAARMKADGIKGHIITVCSIAGLFAGPAYGAYCASKHGVKALMASAKWELRSDNIKISTIYPGRVDTEFFGNYVKKPGQGQMLSADDIAAYIIAIASRSFFKIKGRKILNILKRIYFAGRYFF